MNNNINPNHLIEKIEEITKELPNINMPTMGIIPEENKIEIDNSEFVNNRETKEEKDVK